MTAPDGDEVLRRLDRLAGVGPAPEATERAVARARAALESARNEPAPVSPLHRRFPMLTRTAAAVAALAGAGLIAWLGLGRASAGLAFDEVKQKVQATRTITYKETLSREGQPDETTRVLLLEDGRMRAEGPGGNVAVTDPKQKKVLLLDAKQKKATLVQGLAPKFTQNFYQTIRTAHEQAVKKLPDTEIDGKKVQGFLVPCGEEECRVELTVWVDPATRLPVRFESGGKEEGRAFRHRTHDIVYDAKLDEVLFSLKAPEGYALETQGVAELRPVPDKQDLFAPEVKPGVGLGPVKFGMSKDEVIKALGQPDKIDQRGIALDYLSRGYSLHVSPQRGLMMIICYTQKTFFVKVNDFKGRTAEGVIMGSTRADVEKAYGKPDEAENNGPQTTYLRYPKKGLEFTLFGDKLVQFALSRVSEPQR